MNEIEKALQERFLLQEEYLGNNKAVNKVLPLVSITVATYQHVNYIRDCLEGILMQKTTFPYEIILGEDGSVDGTQEICKEYAEKYPDKIRLFIRDRNLSQYKGDNGNITRFNGVWNRMSVRGKYVAWCDGDDYWIDPLKLQKHNLFLEANPDYGLVHTDFQVQSDANIKEYRINRSFDSATALTSILLWKSEIGTLTVLYRRNIYESLPKFYKGQAFLMGDLPLWIEFASVSKIKYINDVTACYRRLDSSASHFVDFQKQIIFIDNAIKCRLFYAKKFALENLNSDIIAKGYIVKIKICSQQQKRKEAISYLKIVMKKSPIKAFYGFCFLLIAYFPFLYKILSKLYSK